MLSPPANLYRSVQILTDIPGFIENKLVVNTVSKLKLVVKKCFKRYTRHLIEVLEKKFCANLYRSLQILTDVPGFIENKLVVNTVSKLKLVVKKCFKRYTRHLIEVLEKKFCANLYRSLQILTDVPGFIEN